MTQLYTELTMLLIRSYLRDQRKQPLDSLPVKREDLPKEFRDQLFSLAKLAFSGCANREMIFERLPVGCFSRLDDSFTGDVRRKEGCSQLQLLPSHTPRVPRCF